MTRSMYHILVMPTLQIPFQLGRQFPRSQLYYVVDEPKIDVSASLVFSLTVTVDSDWESLPRNLSANMI